MRAGSKRVLVRAQTFERIQHWTSNDLTQPWTQGSNFWKIIQDFRIIIQTICRYFGSTVKRSRRICIQKTLRTWSLVEPRGRIIYWAVTKLYAVPKINHYKVTRVGRTLSKSKYWRSEDMQHGVDLCLVDANRLCTDGATCVRGQSKIQCSSCETRWTSHACCSSCGRCWIQKRTLSDAS